MGRCREEIAADGLDVDGLMADALRGVDERRHAVSSRQGAKFQTRR
jgi:hypothetical protein